MKYLTLVSTSSGAASEAAKEGFPAIAISGASGSEVGFATLQNPSDPATVSAQTYSQLTLRLLSAMLEPCSSCNSSGPLLPPQTALNVNYPPISDSCTDPDDFQYVATRIFLDPLVTNPKTCGTDKWPTDSNVVKNGKCQVSVSVLNPHDKLDASKEDQQAVLDRLGTFLSCSS